MKRKHNGGFSLIEVLVAMAVLGIVTIPTTSALLTAHRMNVKAEQMLEAQLDVSSAVEALMAKGIVGSNDYSDVQETFDVTIHKEQAINEKNGASLPYYNVSVTSNAVDSVSVDTQIRMVG